MASSNSNNISVRLLSRRSIQPFSSLVVVDGYCHCFFCDLMLDFEKKGVATTPGLKCEPCGVEGIMYRGCWNKKRRCTRYATQWKLMTKMPPPPGRRGTRRSLWKWIGWAGAGAVGLAVEQSLRWGDHSPTRLDGGEQDQIHCGGGARSGTRRGRGKIVASEEFRLPFLYMYLCEVLFPHWFFFFLLHCLVYGYITVQA